MGFPLYFFYRLFQIQRLQGKPESNQVVWNKEVCFGRPGCRENSIGPTFSSCFLPAPLLSL